MQFTYLGFRTYLACFVLGAFVCVAVTPMAIRLANRLRIVDRPGGRKAHAEATPLLGGLGIFLGVWTPLILLCFWSNSMTTELANKVHLFAAIFFAGAAMVILGIVDDKRGLRARVKFAIQFTVAIALVLTGVSFGDLTIPWLGGINLGIAGPILTVFWIVGITNALNLIDGIDGLATGVAFFVAITNAIIAIYNENFLLALMMCTLSGACLGFLKYNFAPAKIYLGDTGSLFIGVTLAVTGVAANAKSTTAASMLIPIVVLGYPVMDTLLAMGRRSLLGKSMFVGDRGHIHHRLLAKGLNHKYAALSLYAVCGLFSLAALAVLLENNALIAVAFAVLFGVLLLGAKLLGFLEYLSPHGIRIRRPLFRIAYHFTEYTLAKVAIAEDLESLLALLRRAAQEFGGQFAMDDEQATAAISGEHVILDARRSAAVMEAQGRFVDRFRFKEVGLFFRVEFDPLKQPQDLLQEHRHLFAHIAEAAGDRLRSMKPKANNVPAEPSQEQPR